MDANLVKNVDLKGQYRAALVHQARQPLFALQNYLSATAHVAKRMAPSPDIDLIRKCVEEMQLSVEKLSGCLTKVTESNLEEGPKHTEMNIANFIQETFQIGRFVTRHHNLPVEFEIQPNINGTIRLDVLDSQLSLIQWILNSSSADEFRSKSNGPLYISAELCEDGLLVRARRDASERLIRIVSLAKDPEAGR